MTTEPEVQGATRDASRDRDTIREMIRHEDGLRNDRLGWFLTLNGLLFAGLGFAWNAKNARSATALVTMFAILGVVAGAATLVGMAISDRAIRKLKRWDKEHGGGLSEDMVPVAGIESKELGWLAHLHPWRVLPVTVIGLWVALPFVRAHY